ncbi:hypothetical protein [Nocardia sp. CY41]|uniref:hypothetical protein n=1 Tax=Nocardia sp. CY41 TaxID=2608686 RepID=UPI00135A96AC|nr:hypothetical protein [Nocardia sp. CY41]
MGTRWFGVSALVAFVGSGLLQVAFYWSTRPWLVWPGWVLFVAGMVGISVAVCHVERRARAESEQEAERMRELRAMYERMFQQRDEQ